MTKAVSDSERTYETDNFPVSSRIVPEASFSEMTAGEVIYSYFVSGICAISVLCQAAADKKTYRVLARMQE